MYKKIPDINILHSEKNLKDKDRNKIFNMVLDKCTDKITEANRISRQTFTYFSVPSIILGSPSYNILECVNYIIDKLTKKHYIVNFIEPITLYIDWGINNNNNNIDYIIIQDIIPTSNPTKLKKETKELLKNFPNAKKVIFEYEKTEDIPIKKIKK